MNKALLIAGSLAVGVSTVYLISGFKAPAIISKEEADKKKKIKKIIGFSALGAGLILIGIAAKMHAFK